MNWILAQLCLVLVKTTEQHQVNQIAEKHLFTQLHPGKNTEKLRSTLNLYSMMLYSGEKKY